MKKLLIIVGILISCKAIGQQDPHSTMYMMNPFSVNPALAGTYDYYQIRTNHRFQWLNFKDAPVTNSFSAFGPSPKKPMGFGGTIYNDITGPTSRTGFNGVYAYNIKIKSSIFLSGGLGLGIIQYKTDGTKMTLDPSSSSSSLSPEDPALASQVYSSTVPDASIGFYVYASDFYGGFSVQHIINSRIQVSDAEVGQNNLKPHFYLVGGYKRDVSQGRKKNVWVLEPSIILKKVVPASFQLEINNKVTYREEFWGGISYRTQDAIALLLGYTYKKKIYFAYSYDIALNDIRRYSIGSQELVIGFNFDKVRNVKIVSKKKQ